MPRLLCTGDLHLGAHPEYGRATGDRLTVQRDVLGRIAGLAVEHRVDAILNCGDTFDGPGIPPEQLDVYARFVDACDQVGIPIVAITGNGRHDAAMRDVNGMQIFNRIPGIVVHSQPAIVDLVDGVAIACLPWVHPGRLVAARNGGDRDEVNREAAELLVATARGLRAQIPDDKTAVLLFHGSVSGASTPDGALTDLFREPVLDAYALEQLDFDAVVCGHVHRPQGLGGSHDRHLLFDVDRVDVTYGNARFFYVGSPLPLNFGEASAPHGVWILDTDGAPFSHFVRVGSPPFVTLDYDWTAALDERDPVAEDLETEKISDGAIVRVRYTARRDQRVDTAAIRAQLLEAGAAVVKIVPDIVREDRARVDGVDETLAPLAALDMYVDANEIPADRADAMRARTARYLERVI